MYSTHEACGYKIDLPGTQIPHFRIYLLICILDTLTVQQKATYLSQPLTSGSRCHHLTAVQMSAYLRLWVDYGTQGVSGCWPTTLPWLRVTTVRHHKKTMALKLKMALTITAHIKCQLKEKACTFYLNLYNCCVWNEIIYYILILPSVLLAAVIAACIH